MHQSKFSVIIPTLQNGNSAILKHLLCVLQTDDAVGEVILIDNSLKGYSANQFDKVRVIIPKKNLFVNPSWNLGISLAKYDYFAILNDDLIIPVNLCRKILEKFKKEYLGLVGLSNEINNVKLPPLNFQTKNIIVDNINFEKLHKRDEVTYWGSAIFGAKQDYYTVPENIKIWCGDEYLFYMNKINGKNCYLLTGGNIYHVHSTTSSMRKWRQIKKRDVYNFAKIDKSYKIPNGYNARDKVKHFWLLLRGFFS